MRAGVGLLLLETTWLDGPGTLRDAATLGGTPISATVPGARADRVVGPRQAELGAAYAATARQVEAAGAAAITANCGYAVVYQDDVAASVSAPVALSSLLLVAPLARAYGGRLGVITFDAAQLDGERRAAAGWPEDLELAVADVQASDHWRSLADDAPPQLDRVAMEAHLLAIARGLVARRRLAALLLECTGMIPYRDGLARECGVPVYDVTDAVRLIAGDHRSPDDQRGTDA